MNFECQQHLLTTIWQAGGRLKSVDTTYLWSRWPPVWIFVWHVESRRQPCFPSFDCETLHSETGSVVGLQRPVHLLDLTLLRHVHAASLSVVHSNAENAQVFMTAAMDNRCLNRVGTGCAMGGALGASIGNSAVRCAVTTHCGPAHRRKMCMTVPVLLGRGSIRHFRSFQI